MISCLYFMFLVLCRSLAKARPNTEESVSQQGKGQTDMEFIAKSGMCVLYMSQSVNDAFVPLCGVCVCVCVMCVCLCLFLTVSVSVVCMCTVHG